MASAVMDSDSEGPFTSSDAKQGFRLQNVWSSNRFDGFQPHRIAPAPDGAQPSILGSPCHDLQSFIEGPEFMEMTANPQISGQCLSFSALHDTSRRSTGQVWRVSIYPLIEGFEIVVANC